MEVNFVFQVRTFHRFKREVKLSANAQALWLELFGLFNERRFPDNMPVSTTSLTAMLNISKDGVIRARKELIENGLIEEVGERRGRQHTTYRIKYFTVAPVQTAMESDQTPVDNAVDNLLTDEQDSFCDANIDVTCGANDDANVAAQMTTQCDLCDANIDANCDAKSVCDATCVDMCGTYINNKRIYKLKRKSNGKPKRSLGYIKKSSTTAAAASRATREEALYYNGAWKTDARARARTAQNVIDALGSRRLEDDLNETICRYFQLGLTPEQALEAIRSAGGVSANEALNEAAFRLGVYHAAREAGVIDVSAEVLHSCIGDVRAARIAQKRAQMSGRMQAILECVPGYAAYLRAGHYAERLDVNRLIAEQIEMGKDNLQIVRMIRNTEGYRDYENEQKLAEQQESRHRRAADL